MERTLSSGSHARSRPTRKLNARNSTTSSAVVRRNQRAVSARPPAAALLLALGAAGRFGPPVPLEVADDPVRPPGDALVIDLLAALLCTHQPGPDQDLHVVADGGLGYPEVVHDVAGADPSSVRKPSEAGSQRNSRMESRTGSARALRARSVSSVASTSRRIAYI
jgi:hypothetical protein